IFRWGWERLITYFGDSGGGVCGIMLSASCSRRRAKTHAGQFHLSYPILRPLWTRFFDPSNSERALASSPSLEKHMARMTRSVAAGIAMYVQVTRLRWQQSRALA